MPVKWNDISELKARNDKAFLSLLSPVLLGGIGLFCSLSNSLWMHLLGQLLLSFFFLQTFILLHECGHLNFFKSRILNQFFGHLFGLLTMIPFFTWMHMHHLHHRWTGWRDKDPTTEKTVEPSNSPVLRMLVNGCWLLFIPIFYLAYMLSNYWNLGKIKRHLSLSKYRSAVVHICGYLTIYVLLFLFFAPFIGKQLIPAFLLSFVWKELVIMTQHSHIDIPISNGDDVKPVAYKEQVAYTRSFYIPSWMASFFLFNFNLHEAHHVYPGLPSYWLNKIDLDLPKEPKYQDWLIQAKSMKGEDYVFRTASKTGKYF